MSLVNLAKGCDEDDDEHIRGMPSAIASIAAREKLRSEIMEITVDARQRLKDLRRVGKGAASELPFGKTREMAGRVESSPKRASDAI